MGRGGVEYALDLGGLSTLITSPPLIALPCGKLLLKAYVYVHVLAKWHVQEVSEGFMARLYGFPSGWFGVGCMS